MFPRIRGHSGRQTEIDFEDTGWPPPSANAPTRSSPAGGAWRWWFLVAAALYAVTGATALRFDDAFLTFGLVLAVAGLVWLGGLRFARAGRGT